MLKFEIICRTIQSQTIDRLSRVGKYWSMPKRSSTKKTRTRDRNEVAFDAVQRVIALTEGAERRSERNPAAVALGRLGGLKGGRARAEKLTAAARSEIARQAADARWKHSKQG